jgi:hypothetical protein
MDSLRSWLLGVIFSAFAVELAREMVPKGKEKSLLRMVGGILIALAILRPLGTSSMEITSALSGGVSMDVPEQTEVYRQEQEKALADIIAARLETYIWDKATGLGLECTVRVTVSAGEGMLPLPEKVEIGTAYDSALAAWIEEVVGIPAKKQIWQEGTTWTTEKG